MKKSIFFIFVVITMMFAVACNGSSDATTSVELADEENTSSVTVSGIAFRYPDKYSVEVTVVTTEDRICFLYGETKLFDITINSNEGAIIGTIVDGDTNTVIRCVEYTNDSNDQKIDELKNSINVTLQRCLMSDYTFAIGEALE